MNSIEPNIKNDVYKISDFICNDLDKVITPLLKDVFFNIFNSIKLIF